MVTSLVQLLCRLTKLTWFQDEQFTRLVDDARTFLEKGSSGDAHPLPTLHPPWQLLPSVPLRLKFPHLQASCRQMIAARKIVG